MAAMDGGVLKRCGCTKVRAVAIADGTYGTAAPNPWLCSPDTTVLLASSICGELFSSSGTRQTSRGALEPQVENTKYKLWQADSLQASYKLCLSALSLNVF
eukprot:360213-Chlamydomonas_euryale.AAC.6